MPRRLALPVLALALAASCTPPQRSDPTGAAPPAPAASSAANPSAPPSGYTYFPVRPDTGYDDAGKPMPVVRMTQGLAGVCGAGITQLIVQDDGGFTLMAGEDAFKSAPCAHGRFRLEGDRVTFLPDHGAPFSLRRVDGDLVDAQGVRFTSFVDSIASPLDAPSRP